MIYHKYKLTFKDELTEGQRNIVIGYFQDWINDFMFHMESILTKLKKRNIRSMLAERISSGFGQRKEMLISLIESMIQTNKDPTKPDLFILDNPEPKVFTFMVANSAKSIKGIVNPMDHARLEKQFENALEKRTGQKPEIEISDVEIK